jgi:EmrB/QacA subfamily drug resistance transporter
MNETDQRQPWAILILLCVAQFMVILDVTIVNVALPSIGSDLGFEAGQLSWVVTAYVIFTGGLLLLGGRMADILGRRPIFLAGLALFTGASLASGLAPTPEALIASRAAQGLGAAMLSPAALSLITTTYTGEQRTRALSAWGAIGAGGGAAGLLFGGMLTSWLSWEWVFFINVPIGALALVFAARMIPGAPGTAGSIRELDLPGALTAVAGIVLVVYGIQGAESAGWGAARTLLPIAVALALLAAFAAIERAAARPLIPPSTWSIRSLVSSATVMFGATGLLVGAFFLNSLFLQSALGFSAIETGLAFLPLMIVIGLAAHAGPHLLTRFGARAMIVVGLGLVAAGDLFLSRATAGAGYLADVLPGFLALGVGVGLTFVAVSVTSMSEIGHDRAGLASGLMTTAHEIGAALGVAVFSAIALAATGTGETAFAEVASGYGDATLTGGLIAAAVAVLAALAVPTFRPLHVQGASIH